MLLIKGRDAKKIDLNKYVLGFDNSQYLKIKTPIDVFNEMHFIRTIFLASNVIERILFASCPNLYIKLRVKFSYGAIFPIAYIYKKYKYNIVFTSQNDIEIEQFKLDIQKFSFLN